MNGWTLTFLTWPFLLKPRECFHAIIITLHHFVIILTIVTIPIVLCYLWCHCNSCCCWYLFSIIISIIIISIIIFVSIILAHPIFSWFVDYHLQAMDQASEKGLIFIDGSGPTYATATVRIHLLSWLFLFLMLVSITAWETDNQI